MGRGGRCWREWTPRQWLVPWERGCIFSLDSSQSLAQPFASLHSVFLPYRQEQILIPLRHSNSFTCQAYRFWLREESLHYSTRKESICINSHCLKSVYELNEFYVKCSFVWDSRYGRQIALESWTRFQYVQCRYIWLLVIGGLIVGFVQQREGYFVPPLQSPSASPGNVSFLRTPQTRLLILKWRFFFAVLPPSMELMMQFFAWAEKFLYNCSSLRVKSGRCDRSFWLKRHTCCDRSSRLKSN